MLKKIPTLELLLKLFFKKINFTHLFTVLVFISINLLTVNSTYSQVTIDIPVITGNDDAEERVSNGSMDLTSSDLEFCTESSDQYVGIRFQNVTVPLGSTVTKAYIQFHVDETNSTSVTLNIVGIDVDNSSTFTSNSNNISDRIDGDVSLGTTASVSWTPANWPSTSAEGVDQRTPELNTIVQEVIDRTGWSTGNSMSFVFTKVSGSGKRVAESYNGDPSNPPILHIEYSTGPCTQPTAQPTSLTFTSVTDTQIDGSFTASASADSYLVLYNTDGSVPTPIDGITYTVGNTIGTSTVVDTDSNTNFFATGLTANTTYYFYVFSKNSACSGGPDYLATSPLIGNETTIISYCNSYGNTSYQTGTERVIFNTIDNADGDNADNAYEDFTSISTDVFQGQSYNLDIYANNGEFGKNNNKHNSYAYTYVWIDWNQDGDFNDINEEYYLGYVNSTNQQTSNSVLSITIPLTATLGSTRMRVSTKYDDYIFSSCETGFDGEVEDYTINVISSTPMPEINVQGNSTTILDGDITPTTADYTDFGSIGTASTFTRTFTIQNIGTATLNLTDTPIVSVSGNAAFTILTQPTASSIASGGADLTFVVQFAPTVGGTVQAVISIANNDTTGSEDPYNFTIQGYGDTPLTEGPGGVTSDLKLWLKANDGLGYTDGQSVSLWADQGRGSDATVPTGGLEPTYKDNISDNVNFNSVVDFNNDPTASVETYNYSKEVLIGGSGYSTQDIFIVLIPDVVVNPTFGFMDVFCGDEDISTPQTDGSGIGLGGYSERFTNEIISYAVGTTSSGDGYGVAEIGTGNTYSNAGIINARNNSSATLQELYYNASNIGNVHNDTDDFSNIDDSRYWIGRSEGWDATTNARIAEIITYSARKDDINYNDERRKIESYLAIKYGITLADSGLGTTQDYVDSAGNIIWDESADAGVYNFDIAGIGRDDDSELNQKQSRSVNSATNVTIGHREIATTNSGNGNNFDNNLDFLVWGHNNDALSGTDDIIVDLGASSTSVTTMFDRRWKIKETCSTGGDVLDVKVSIPTSAFALTAPAPDFITTQPALIISSTANFSDVVDVIPMVADGSGNFETWYDFDDTRYFTFGIATKVEGKHDVSYTADNFLVGENTVTLNTNYTVSAWVRNLGGGGTFVSKNGAYDFRINASGYVEASYNGAIAKTSSVTVNDSKWHHITISDDGSGVSMYIDGVLDGAKGTSVAPITSIGRFAIGVVYTDKNNITPIFNGDIDEVRIWERALTQPQIQYIMNQEMVNNSSFVNGATLPDSVTLNEVSAVSWSDVQVYHNINNFYGTTVVDGSGNNNWLRIKYLVPGKQVIDNQTAPLPYVSTADTNWDLSTTWLNGDEQYIPGSASIVDSSVTVDWNIVQISSNVDMDNSLPAINNDTRKLLGLYIDSTKELTVNGSNPTDYNPDSGIGNGLTISHYFELNGTIDLEGESQLIQTTDSDLVVGTNGMLEKDQQGEGNRYRYNDWSLPVYTETGGNTAINGTGNYTTVAAALKDGTTPSSPLDITFVGGYDGGNTTSPIEIANYWIYKYANLPDGNYSAWQQVESTGDIYAGEGYLMKGVGDPGEANQNYVFQGKPNNGDITLTIGVGNDYLVGNPYPSAIDGIQFLNDNAPASGVTPIKGSIYFWSHYGGDSHNLADYQAGYATLNLLGGALAASAHPSVDTSVNGTVEPEQYIPVGQGFFVWAEDGGTIKFRNSQRYYKTEASGESIFMKGEQEKTSKTNSTEDTRPKIRIGFNAPSIDHRQLLVGADTKASDAIDWGYDSKMYEVFNDDMYWLIENDKYVIQGINTIDSDTELPIGIKSSQGGLISIEVDELINTPEDIEVYVLDKQTGLTYNIKNEAFETVLEANTNFSDKYAIVFKEAIALSVEEDEFLNTNMLVFMNNADKEIVIKNNTNVDVEGIQLINYLGQTSNEWNKSFDQNTINLPINVATGIYFIRINTPKGVVNKKIIIK